MYEKYYININIENIFKRLFNVGQLFDISKNIYTNILFLMFFTKSSHDSHCGVRNFFEGGHDENKTISTSVFFL